MDDAFAVYHVEGAPKLVPSAVLFLDVLGTASRRGDAEAQAYLELTKEAFRQARDWGDSKAGADEVKVAAWFSDNLVMGVPIAGDLRPGDVVDFLVMHAALHQLALGDAGLFARGGITFGPFYADAEFVNGPALNEAYDLEARAANSPRVILSPAAISALLDEPTSMMRDSYLAVGDDGVTFVDYLRYVSYVSPTSGDETEVLRRHRDRVRENLDRFATNLRIVQKYAWLASYHDARVPGDLMVRPGSSPSRFRIVDPGMEERAE